jgi:aminoglycoside phosphotransferase (APT) family kinase protein
MDPVVTPEDTWERSVALPTIDRAWLGHAFAGLDPDLAAREWTVLAGGLRSVNLKSGDLVARIAVGDTANVHREAALLRHVAARVCVPEVIDVSDTVLLMRFVPHGPLPASTEVGRAVGATAAAIHSTHFAAAGMLDEALQVREPWSSVLDGLREHVDMLLNGGAGRRLGARAQAIRARWDRHAARMYEAARHSVLVHSDFKPTNVKWTHAARVLVLDWEFAWSGPALFDVGQLLRWDPPPAFTEGFAAGYLAEGGTLPEDWRTTAMLFDLFNLVFFANDEAIRPIRDRDVLARIDRTLAACP